MAPVVVRSVAQFAADGGCRARCRSTLAAVVIRAVALLAADLVELLHAAGADVLPGPTDQLAAGRFAATENVPDLRIAVAEDVMQEKGGALQRTESLQDHHEGVRDLFLPLDALIGTRDPVRL